jgi:hypothetical protein
MSWSEWVPTQEAHARASGRRGVNKRRQEAAQARRDQVRPLLQRWGTSVAARVKIATLLHVSLRTVTRDMHALQERLPLPIICPLCHLPSRLDVDPSTLTGRPRRAGGHGGGDGSVDWDGGSGCLASPALCLARTPLTIAPGRRSLEPKGYDPRRDGRAGLGLIGAIGVEA